MLLNHAVVVYVQAGAAIDNPEGNSVSTLPLNPSLRATANHQVTY